MALFAHSWLSSWQRSRRCPTPRRSVLLHLEGLEDLSVPSVLLRGTGAISEVNCGILTTVVPPPGGQASASLLLPSAAGTKAAPLQQFPVSDLSVSITPPQGAVKPGDQKVKFTITIQNHGPDPAPASVDLTITLPAGVTLVSEKFVSGNDPKDKIMDTTANGQPSFNLAGMKKNSTDTFEVIVSIDKNFTKGQIKAEVVGQGTTDPNPKNNTATVEVLKNK
jgi:uncharacterized repeat protein (TIGR01451 family)